MKWKMFFVVLLLSLSTGCSNKKIDDSTYVLIRHRSSGEPGLRAYFMDGDASLNGVDCRELLTLANEAVEARKDKGEIYLMKYECVSLREARERGFK